MSFILLIVESPAKCKKIESFLGNDYKVLASFGHFRNLENINSININKNFEPKYSLIKESIKLKQIEKLKNYINNSREVILATDDDREGECIAWHICDYFGLSINSTKRIIFHEITERALKNSLKNPQKINMNLVKAAQSRQILDLIVGYSVSPVLWKNFSSYYDKGLSAGRCQTPALRLVYDNYISIKESPGNLIYNIFGIFTNLNLNYELNNYFNNEEEVLAILNKFKLSKFYINVLEPSKTYKKSPLPFSTSLLQQVASNILKYSPKITMNYAQQLYENGYITYMRTPCQKYSIDFINSCSKYINENYGLIYLNDNLENLTLHLNEENIEIEENKQEENKQNKKKKQKKENNEIQEAHEAIRPVNINILPSSLNIDQKAIKLYELIWFNSLESLMKNSEYNSIKSLIKIIYNNEILKKNENNENKFDKENEFDEENDFNEENNNEFMNENIILNDDESKNDYYFIYKTQQMIFPGWEIVKKKYEENNPIYNYLLNLKQNIEVKYKKIESKFTLKNLKSHYSEASLVKLLEKKGIGRPSTFASLVDKIQERGYVLKQNVEGKELNNNDYILQNSKITKKENKKKFGNEKGKLVIQPLGILIIEFLINKFEQFFNYEYTKNMEDDLDLIAKGNKIWYSLCSDCYNNLNNIIEKVLENVKENKFLIKIDDEHSIIMGKYGPIIKKETKNIINEEIKEIEKIEEIGENKLKKEKKQKIKNIVRKNLKLLETNIDENINENENIHLEKKIEKIEEIEEKEETIKIKKSKKLKNKIEFIQLKKDINIEDLKNGNLENIKIEDLVDNNKFNKNNEKYIGKYKNEDLIVKYGKFGYYVVYGENKKSLNELNINSFENINLEKIINYLENGIVNNNNNNEIILLNKNISIRNGKYGYYIYYKPPKSQKVQFFDIKKYKGDFKNENKEIILKWIKEVYNIE